MRLKTHRGKVDKNLINNKRIENKVIWNQIAKIYTCPIFTWFQISKWLWNQIMTMFSTKIKMKTIYRCCQTIKS